MMGTCDKGVFWGKGRICDKDAIMGIGEFNYCEDHAQEQIEAYIKEFNEKSCCIAIQHMILAKEW